jgi:hypothetical protein
MYVCANNQHGLQQERKQQEYAEFFSLRGGLASFEEFKQWQGGWHSSTAARHAKAE